MKPEQLISALQVLTMKQPEWHYCAAIGITTKRAQVGSCDYTVQHSYVNISLGWSLFCGCNETNFYSKETTI